MKEAERLRAIEEAARAFVGTTSCYRQQKESRPEFEALAVALLVPVAGGATQPKETR